MKIEIVPVFLFLFFSTSLFSQDGSQQISIGADPKATVCFTPGGDCIGLIVSEINKCEDSAFVQAYSFTSKPIADALIEAQKRGVKVEIVLDKSQSNGKGSKAEYIARQGRIQIFIDREHAIAHNKIMILDGTTLITGSFNFTANAQNRNAENLIILHDPTLLALYKRNYQKHFEHSGFYFSSPSGTHNQR